VEIGRRLIGASAIISPAGEVTGVDLDGLVRRLLLFDKYVLASVRLKEFPLLAIRLGYGQLRELLSSNLIDIRCECFQLAQIGQSGIFGDPVLPPFWYRFNWIDASDREKYVHDCLQEMHGVPGLAHKEIIKLKRLIGSAIAPLPAEIRPELFPAFRNELLNNTRLVRKSVELAIDSKTGLNNVPFSLELHQEAEDTFSVSTDIARHLNASETECHRIIERGLMGVAGLSQSIGEMKGYSALSGFRDEELPLFRHKLDFMAEVLSSHSKERSFQRVVDIAGLPQLASQEGTVNVENLLKIRESSEAREFRDWLGSIGRCSDAEVAERVSSLRNLAGLRVSDETGKMMRFLVTSAAGFFPALGIPLGVFDQFVLDKVLPRSGITAFVSELYPSIFEIKR
jgi:hypothetical protein